jgi:hypothetical protein
VIAVPRPWAVPVHPYDFDLAQAVDWSSIRPTWVLVNEITPTQNHLVINHLSLLLEGFPPNNGDPYSHIVLHNGQLYEHDGAHRNAIQWLGNCKWILARVVAIDSSVSSKTIYAKTMTRTPV